VQWQSTSHPTLQTGVLNTGSSLVVSCSPFKQSSGLIAQGSEARVTVLMRATSSELEESEYLDFTQMDFHHSTRITSLAWSPLSLSPTPENPKQETKIEICTAGADFKIRHYSSLPAGGEDPRVVLLSGHSDYINSCSFSPSESALRLASVSDDHSCRIWDVEAETETDILQLRSAGTSVKFHPSLHSQDQIMVAEESGTIKFYDLRSKCVTLTCHTEGYPLTDADWIQDPRNTHVSQFGCVTKNKWYIWTQLQPNSKNSPLVGEIEYNARHFRFSPSDPAFFCHFLYQHPTRVNFQSNSPNHPKYT